MTSARTRSFWAIGNTIVIIVAIVPVLWIASLSFKDPSTITDATFFPRKWTLQNYRGIFDTSLFTRALGNSIGIAVIATALAVVVGSMAAYAIARLRFPGKGLLVGASLLIAIFPAISLVSPLFNLWRQLGLFDTWPGSASRTRIMRRRPGAGGLALGTPHPAGDLPAARRPVRPPVHACRGSPFRFPPRCAPCRRGRRRRPPR